MWQPIETAPKDQFLLLCGPSGYTTTPMVVTTGRMCSDYHAGRWIDHANDNLTDWGFKPTHWAPLVLPGAQPSPGIPEITDDLIEAIESRAEQSFRRHHSGVRGQLVTPADDLSWHIIHVTRDVLATAQEAKP